MFGTVNRKCLGSKEMMETLHRQVRPGKLALDWVTENVYFVERSHTIKTCHFGVERCANILNTTRDASIDALAVDPVAKYVHRGLVLL